MGTTSWVRFYDVLRFDDPPLIVGRDAWVVVLGGKPHVLEPEHIVVGSAPDCEIRVEGESVASRHAELIATASGVLLRQLDPTQVTRVDGQIITEQLLTGGERVQLGSLVFEVARIRDVLRRVRG